MMVLMFGMVACATHAPPPPPESMADAVEAPRSASAPEVEAVRRWSQIPSQPEQRLVEGRLARHPRPVELGGGVDLVLRLEGGALVELPIPASDPSWSALEGRLVRVEGLLRPGVGPDALPLLAAPGAPQAVDPKPPRTPALHLAPGPLDGAAALASEVLRTPLLVFGEASLPGLSLPEGLDAEALFARLAEAASVSTGSHGGLRWLAPADAPAALQALGQAPTDEVVAHISPSRLQAPQVAEALAAELRTSLRQVPSGWLMAAGALPAKAGLEVLASAAGGALEADEAGWRLGGGSLPPMSGAGHCEPGQCCADLDVIEILGLAPGPRARALVDAPGVPAEVVGLGDPLGCGVVRPADALTERWIVSDIRADALVLRFESTGRERSLPLASGALQ
ncbi:MAG: hypothetical protein H6741_09085 [Alphaproteobacteria bacterium]|nr:hypothetical protein [Alphaproteobacteria bacterium]